MAQGPITASDMLSRPDLLEFLMNYIERRKKEQSDRLIAPQRRPEAPPGGILSSIFNVRTQEVGPPSGPMRGLHNLMNPGVDILVPTSGDRPQRTMQFDPTGAIGALKPILLPGKSKYIGRTVQAGRPVVDAIENDRAIQAIIPELNKALKKADNLGFESANEARSAIRNYGDWVGRWDVEDLPDLMKLGNAYSDLVENQKAIEAAGRAIPLYTRRSNWEEIKDYLLELRSQTRPARVGGPKATKMLPPGDPTGAIGSAKKVLQPVKRAFQSADEAFTSLASSQRGVPERLMTEVQKAHGGGVLFPVVEDVGDLTHRMAEWGGGSTARQFAFGREYVKEKVDRSLRTLNAGLNDPRRMLFKDDHAQNLRNNAAYLKVPEDQFKKRIDNALRAYGDAHRQLPVYNTPQRLARDAAVALGQGDFDTARNLLQSLKRIVDDPKKWIEEAGAFNTEGGFLIPLR